MTDPIRRPPGTARPSGVPLSVNASEPTPRPRRVGALAAVLSLAVVLVVAGWWLRRSARADALDAALAGYSPTLPATDAPVDAALADLGAEVFDASCAACHAVTGESRVGPDLAGVTTRRSPEWITAMVLRPDSMTEHDPDARALKGSYGIQMMVPGGSDPRRARAVLEFLRRVDAGR